MGLIWNGYKCKQVTATDMLQTTLVYCIFTSHIFTPSKKVIYRKLIYCFFTHSFSVIKHSVTFPKKAI